ncbi:hypothetical protein PVA38_11270 [Streptococcus pneumoniae D39]|nr:hypothetical protein PVA38_11270 [Streptococcus pneumoniae D39]
MCIRDRYYTANTILGIKESSNIASYEDLKGKTVGVKNGTASQTFLTCLLYTSDAADEARSVDLGGRRIIKKKNVYNFLCKSLHSLSNPFKTTTLPSPPLPASHAVPKKHKGLEETGVIDE